jgi:hypothetical protein
MADSSAKCERGTRDVRKSIAAGAGRTEENQPPLVTGFDDSVMNPPLIHTPQRPPQPDVHTTGCPFQDSAGFGGAQAGGGSPKAGAGAGGGSAPATEAPRPRVAVVRPTATATAQRVDLVSLISTIPQGRSFGPQFQTVGSTGG